MCVCGLYIYFFGLSYCCFFGWHCCLRGVLFFILGWGWGWWFWIDFGGVGVRWGLENHVSYFRYMPPMCHDYQNNSYCILIVITWYLLHRSMYELLIEFVVSSESHFRKWKKTPKQIPILVYLYRNNYNLLITRCVYNPCTGVASRFRRLCLGLLRASLITFYHKYI